MLPAITPAVCLALVLLGSAAGCLRVWRSKDITARSGRYTCLYICLSMHSSMYICVYTHVCTHFYAHVYTHIYKHFWRCMDITARSGLYTRLHTRLHTHLHTRLHTRLHTCRNTFVALPEHQSGPGYLDGSARPVPCLTNPPSYRCCVSHRRYSFFFLA